MAEALDHASGKCKCNLLLTPPYYYSLAFSSKAEKEEYEAYAKATVDEICEAYPNVRIKDSLMSQYPALFAALLYVRSNNLPYG